MKKVFFILFVTLMSLISSCNSGPQPSFFVTVEREFDIPANLSTIPTHFFTLKNVPTLFDESLDIHNRTIDDIVSVNPGDASISTLFQDVDWTFVDKVEIWVISRIDNSRRARLFFTDQADFGNRSEVKMFNTFVDAKEIMSEGLIDVEVRIKTRAFVPSNIQARLVFNYAVFEEL